MALTNDRQCFYCKQSFQSCVFHAHLKYCSARTNRRNRSSFNYNKKQSLWICPICTFENTQCAKACVMCQEEKDEETIPSISHNESWECDKCTYINSLMNVNCDICRNTQPGFQSNKNNNNNNNNGECAATLKLLEQFLCILCKKNEGFELQCNHNLCTKCAKQYIEENEEILCPYPNGCGNNGIISDYVIKECNLSKALQEKCEQMKKKYIISCDPTITTCPQCKEVYYTEDGDMKSVDKNEKCPNGDVLSYKHLQHKAKYRFRCEKIGCKTIFCSGCECVPYHIGYTCNEYKQYKLCKKCRFCEVSLKKNNKSPDAVNVCNALECTDKKQLSCDLQHECGHFCIGLRGYECVPCLNKKCVAKNAGLNDGDFCNICWVDPLRLAPCVELKCGHYFHFLCLCNKIKRKWPGARITFGFLNCPLCKKEIIHPAMDNITKKYRYLKKEIQKDAIDRIKIEDLNLDNEEKLISKSSVYYNNLPKYAMDRLAFYLCSLCNKPYFGGFKQCEEAGMEQSEEYNKKYLICGSCASGSNSKSCKTHGSKYITYKCKFCCSVASFFCWGSTHFCDKCHKKQAGGDYLNRKHISELPKCAGKEKCPLGIEHPANGTEYSMGCVVCLRK